MEAREAALLAAEADALADVVHWHRTSAADARVDLGEFARNPGGPVAATVIDDQDLKRGALADLCHVSPSEFSHAFRREQGTTFEHFLLEYRVAKARDFLAEPHMAISQVAYSAGFSDASYFSRVFRRLTGVTASEYQRRVRLSASRPDTSA